MDDDNLATDDFEELISGDFTIENQGVEYSVDCSIKSVFDPTHSRLFGKYSSYDTDLINLQKIIYFQSNPEQLEYIESEL